jgi:hypothetical protein
MADDATRDEGDFVLVDREFYRRASAAIRYYESVVGGTGKAPYHPRESESQWPTTVQVVSPYFVEMNRSGAPGSSGSGSGGPKKVRLYPGLIVAHNEMFDEVPKQFSPTSTCWVEEINNRELVPDRFYNGYAASAYQDLVIILVDKSTESLADMATGIPDADCPVWSCCSQASGCVTCLPNPDDPGSTAWLSMACTPWDQPGSGGFFDPASNNGDPSCGFWSCDGGDTPCPNGWEDYCGCSDPTVGGPYPYYGRGSGAVDLQSTGIAPACLFTCYNNRLYARKAHHNIVPGGPFGLRPALLADNDGHELHTTTD